MRNIKFRAWNKDTNEFILPANLVYRLDGHLFDREFDEELHNVELLQYTGLKDRNGKEIYEGDILDFEEKEWGDVFKPEIIKMDNIIGNWEYCGTVGDVACWRTVIGNEYENPELLP